MSSTAKLLKIPSNFTADDVIDPQRSYSRSFEPKILCFGFEMLKIQNQYKVNTKICLLAITGKKRWVLRCLCEARRSFQYNLLTFNTKKCSHSLGKKRVRLQPPYVFPYKNDLPSFFRNRNLLQRSFTGFLFPFPSFSICFLHSLTLLLSMWSNISYPHVFPLS